MECKTYLCTSINRMPIFEIDWEMVCFKTLHDFSSMKVLI